jgi:hypothetical protein
MPILRVREIDQLWLDFLQKRLDESGCPVNVLACEPVFQPQEAEPVDIEDVGRRFGLALADALCLFAR